MFAAGVADFVNTFGGNGYIAVVGPALALPCVLYRILCIFGGKVVAPVADDEAARAAEEKRLADEAEAQRLADIEAARVAEEKRLADEAGCDYDAVA